MSKERAMKNWRKRLDEFDGDDDEVVAEYRWFVSRHRREHLADMLHEDGMINDLIGDCLASYDDDDASVEDHRLGKKTQEYVDDAVDYCMGKHMWWDEFTLVVLNQVEGRFEVDYSGMHEAESLRLREE